jgi:hypothetical protein
MKLMVFVCIQEPTSNFFHKKTYTLLWNDNKTKHTFLMLNQLRDYECLDNSISNLQ